jgi:collagen type VI alpha
MKMFVITGCLLLLALTGAESEDEECRGNFKADIYFLNDASRSIHPNGWAKSLNFVANIANRFEFGFDGVQCAFGVFSTDFDHALDLDQATDKEEFVEKVLSTRQLKQLTHTYTALNFIDKLGYLLSEEHGARPDVPKFLILTTDGQSQNQSKTIAAAENLRNQGVTIFAVGVGGISMEELIGISGDESNVFSVKNFGQLNGTSDQISQKVCQASKKSSACPEQFQNEIIFLIDVSSVKQSGDNEWKRAFMTEFLTSFHIDENSTHVGMIVYSVKAVTQSSLSPYADKFIQDINTLPYRSGARNTHSALLEANIIFKGTEFGGRENVTRTVIILQNGNSSQPLKTYDEAQQLRDAGINVFSIIMNAESDTKININSLASKREWNIRVNKDSSMIDMATYLAASVCNANSGPQQECSPDAKIDLFGVVDASGSVPKGLFKNNFKFLEKLISGFTLSESGTKFSLITFSTAVDIHFDLSSDRNFVQQSLANVTHSGGRLGSTKTFLALNNIFKSGISTPQRGARPDAQKVVLVITDGESDNTTRTLKAGEDLKKQGFLMIVLAVGEELNLNETEALATVPNLSFRVGDYHSLDYTASDIANVVCNSAAANTQAGANTQGPPPE